MSTDAIDHIISALDQMLTRVERDTFRYERVHVEADLRYLRAEAERAREQMGVER